MKIEINRPLTEEDHRLADEQHRRTAANQKQYLKKIADLLETGQQLDRMQIEFAAAALRHVADQIPMERKSGHKHKLPGELAVLYSIKRIHQGKGSNETIKMLAEEFDASEPAVRKELKNQDYKSVMAWVAAGTKGSKPSK